MKHSSWICAALLGISLSVQAADITYAMRQNFIQTWRDIAIQEMKRSGIPASIIMAQAILESGWGQGDLARNANNYFGIKCKNEDDWNRRVYFQKDDDYDESGQLTESCFRTYESAWESFVHHTDFLMYREYYKGLFKYSHTDYEHWAYGLQACGYATNPNYANALIDIIKKYNLSTLDYEGYVHTNSGRQRVTSTSNTSGVVQSNMGTQAAQTTAPAATGELDWEIEFTDISNSDRETETESEQSATGVAPETSTGGAPERARKRSYFNRIQPMQQMPALGVRRR